MIPPTANLEHIKPKHADACCTCGAAQHFLCSLNSHPNQNGKLGELLLCWFARWPASLRNGCERRAARSCPAGRATKRAKFQRSRDGDRGRSAVYEDLATSG